MRSILISIKPQWVEKILNGDKTIEIRKSIPECKMPIKVYIYCTKGNKELRLFNQKVCASFKIPRTKTYSISQKKAYTKFIGDESQSLNGKIVAEFTLNKVEELENTILPTIPTCVYLTKTKRFASAVEKESCLSQDEIYNYLGGKNGYAWYIDDLKIYDQPKELSELKVYDKTYDNVGAFGWAFDEKEKYHSLKRPPQSWCYVEEKGEEV